MNSTKPGFIDRRLTQKVNDNLKEINRVTVITKFGREFDKELEEGVVFSIQDEGKTLKLIEK